VPGIRHCPLLLCACWARILQSGMLVCGGTCLITRLVCSAYRTLSGCLASVGGTSLVPPCPVHTVSFQTSQRPDRTAAQPTKLQQYCMRGLCTLHSYQPTARMFVPMCPSHVCPPECLCPCAHPMYGCADVCAHVPIPCMAAQMLVRMCPSHA
jgi:hypothetical protein